MFNLIGLELYMRINPDISFMLVSFSCLFHTSCCWVSWVLCLLLVSFMGFMFVVGEGFYSFDSMLVDVCCWWRVLLFWFHAGYWWVFVACCWWRVTLVVGKGLYSFDTSMKGSTLLIPYWYRFTYLTLLLVKGFIGEGIVNKA